MFGLTKTLLGRMRYRRRWSGLAAAAAAAADSATADFNRRRYPQDGARQSDTRATDEGWRPVKPPFPPSSAT